MSDFADLERAARRRPARGARRKAFLVLVLASACELDDCTGPEDLFDIVGTVLVNDQPAQGVTVNAGDKTTTTATDGTFRLTFLKTTTVPTISVVPPAGVHFRETVLLVAASGNATVDFVGYREADISGRVLAFGQPVPGIRLELEGISITRTTTSAADGTYRFDDVPPSLIVPHRIDVLSGPAGFELGTAGIGIDVSILGFDIVLDLVGGFAGGGRISGRVTSSGVGLGGVTVSATGGYTTADTTTTGGNYFLAPLPPGPYTVSIAGFDASLHPFTVTSRSITLVGDTVVDFAAVPIMPNQPPSAAIQQPADGATFSQGMAIAFQGSGTDAEDGTLTGAALVWTSSLDGALGTGAALTLASLSVGTHTITLTATDAQGLTTSAAITVSVTAAPQQPGSIGGSVTANGNPIGDVVVTLSGTQSAAMATAGNGTYAFADLAPGTYTVTITNPFPGVTFPALSQTVTLGPGQNLTVNFPGVYSSLPAR